jgi:hypothetical protein
MKVVVKESATERTVVAHCGGTWEDQENFAELKFNKATGLLISVFIETYLANFSLPTGQHSGPFKHLYSRIQCGNGSTDVAQIKKQLETK